MLQTQQTSRFFYIFFFFLFLSACLSAETGDDAGTQQKDSGADDDTNLSNAQEDWTRLENGIATFLTCSINERYARSNAFTYLLEPQKRDEDRNLALEQEIEFFREKVKKSRLSPHIKVHKLYLEKCLNFIEKAKGVECLFPLGAIENCRLAINGDAVDNATCLFDEECVDGSYCLLDSEGCPTVCKKLRKANEGCDPVVGERCARGFTCDAASLFCVADAPPKVYPQEGEACLVNLRTDACGLVDNGRACLLDENQLFTCQKIKAVNLGEECHIFGVVHPRNVCLHGFTEVTCRPNNSEGDLGTCVKRPKLGENCFEFGICNPEKGQCILESVENHLAECKPFLQEGENCIVNPVTQTPRLCEQSKNLSCVAAMGEQFGTCQKTVIKEMCVE